MENRKVIVSSSVSMVVFALITISMVFAFYLGTVDKVALSEQAHRQGILKGILGSAGADAKVVFTEKSWGTGARATTGYLVSTEGKAEGVILNAVTKDGYNGAIEMLIGINPRREVISVGVVRHSETPGLGDKIETAKSDWIKQFEGRRLTNTNWEVKANGGDFDSLTGATISSRAVIKRVEQTLRQANRIDKIYEE